MRKFKALLSTTLTASLLAATAFGQTASTTREDAVKLEKFEVTGSRLSGATAEGALSISRYKMDDAIISGYSNVAEMLRKKLPQFGGGIGTVNEGFGNGGSGESTVSLRDLPGSRTLFLVNGRRTNADLNLIPKSAIERVEILNDGASAVYGTDAVAGVVNFVLKKNYEGAEFFGRFSNTTDTDVSEQRFSMVAGGKIAKTAFTISVENSRANSQFSTDRAVSTPAGSSVSATSNPGVFTPISLAAETTAATAAGNVRVPLRWFVKPAAGGAGLRTASQIPAAFNPAVFLTLPSSMSVPARNAARDAEEARLNGVLGASSPVQYGPNAVLLPGVNAGFPFGYYTLSVRPHERTGIVLDTETELTSKLTFFTNTIVSRNQSENNLAPSPLSGRTLPATNYWYRTVFPTAAATGRSYSFGYRPAELGPRITYNEFEETRIVAGLKGEIVKGWDFQVGVMNDLWTFKQLQTGGVYSTKYNDALAAGTAGAAFNPYGYTPLLSTTSPVNSDSFIASLKGEAGAREHQKTRQYDGSLSGELFELPAGTLKMVVGAEKRNNFDHYEPDSSLQTGAVFPFNVASAYKYERSVTSYYAELEVPVIKGLTLPLAIRHEKFSDTVGSTGWKPRVAFRWEPLAKELTVRGSWSKGFVAPSMGNLDAGAPSQSFTELFNPITKVRTQATQGSIFIGNPNLKPAKSDTYLIGAVYSPRQVKGLSVGINYYRIKENGIPFESDQYIVNQWFAAGPTSATNPFGPNAAVSAQNPLGSQVAMNVDGSLNQIRNVGPVNTGVRLTDGIDLFGTYDFTTEVGKFSLDTSWTTVRTFEMEDFPGAGMINYLGKYWGSGSALGNYGFPKWKGSAGLTWKKSVYSAGVNYSYVDGYKEDENDDNQVPSFGAFDVRASYRFPSWGWGMQMNVGVNNVFNRQPPFVATSFEGQYDRAIGDIRGRIWFVELNKKF
jgi:iron complex outermembrane receptor protein